MAWVGFIGALGCLYGFLKEDGRILFFGLVALFICLVVHEIKSRRS